MAKRYYIVTNKLCLFWVREYNRMIEWVREPVDLILILNVHDHGPVHVPHVDPLELRVAIGQEPDVVSDHVKCKYNARSHDFSVRGAVRYKSLL